MGRAQSVAEGFDTDAAALARALRAAAFLVGDPDVEAAAVLRILGAACYQIVHGLQWADAEAVYTLAKALAEARGHRFDPDDVREAFEINEHLERDGYRIALGLPNG